MAAKKIESRSNFGHIDHYPLAANTTIEHGNIVGVNASGYLSATPTLILGVAMETVSAVSAGEKKCRVGMGLYGLTNGTGADLLGIGDVGDTVYFISGNTVGKTDGGGTRLSVGKLVNVDAGGATVTVKVGI